MKNKKMMGVIMTAALLLALSASPAAYGQPDGFFSNTGGSSSWGSFNNAGPNDNFNGGGSWGNFNNACPNDNFSGGSSWSNFNNTSPDASLGGGLAILSVAGFGYACAKRRKAKRQGLHSKC